MPSEVSAGFAAIAICHLLIRALDTEPSKLDLTEGCRVVKCESQLPHSNSASGARERGYRRRGGRSIGGINAGARSSRDERRQEARVDPDTKLHPLVGRQVGILGPERGLDYGGALHRVHHAGEFCYAAVPCGINEAPAVMLDKAVDQLAVGSKGAQRRLFTLPMRRL